MLMEYGSFPKYEKRGAGGSGNLGTNSAVAPAQPSQAPQPRGLSVLPDRVNGI